MSSNSKKIKSLIYSDTFHLFLILLMIFLTRFGYWNLIYVGSTDEITYLLAGREFLNGLVPYRDFYEIKPPVAFLPYALANIFENEILAIRIFGFISITFCTYLLFKQSSKITSIFVAKIIALTFVLLNSEFLFQASGLTIFIYPFLLLISNILIFKKENYLNYFIVGLCVSMICLIRPNFYPLVFGIILIFYLFSQNKIKGILFYITGGVLPVLIIILSYLQIDNGMSILGNLVLNFTAIGGYLDFSWTIREIVRYLFDDIVGVIFLSSIFLVILNFKDYIKNKQNLIILILFLSTLCSVIIVFTANFQFNNFYPYLMIFIASIFRNVKIKNSRIKSQISIVLLCSTIPFLLNSSIAIIKNFNFLSDSKKKVFSYDLSKSDKNNDAIKSLEKIIKSKETIYAYDNFFYLKLDKNLPSTIIHPTLLKRLNVLKNINGAADTYEGEFENIFSKNPDWLIIRKDTFDNTGYFSKKIKMKINDNYKLFSIVEANDNHYLFKKGK